MMKILVGILYCIENEYPDALWALQQQTYTHFDYFQIEKLSNKEAHDALYQTFMSNASHYGLFLKLDADMVLSRKDFLDQVANVVRQQQTIDDLVIGVHDFFTDRIICGLHVYSNRVVWQKNEERVFTDMVDDSRRRVQDMDVLAPAAWHSPNPSHFQAFHFGVHKAVKFWQIGALNVNHYGRKIHFDNIIYLYQQWIKRKDSRLGIAVIGAFKGLVERFDYRFVDYDSKLLSDVYEPYRLFDSNEMDQTITSLICHLKSPSFQADLSALCA